MHIPQGYASVCKCVMCHWARLNPQMHLTYSKQKCASLQCTQPGSANTFCTCVLCRRSWAAAQISVLCKGVHREPFLVGEIRILCMCPSAKTYNNTLAYILQFGQGGWIEPVKVQISACITYVRRHMLGRSRAVNKYVAIASSSLGCSLRDFELSDRLHMTKRGRHIRHTSLCEDSLIWNWCSASQYLLSAASTAVQHNINNSYKANIPFKNSFF